AQVTAPRLTSSRTRTLAAVRPAPHGLAAGEGADVPDPVAPQPTRASASAGTAAPAGQRRHRRIRGVSFPRTSSCRGTGTLPEPAPLVGRSPGGPDVRRVRTWGASGTRRPRRFA